MEVATYCHIHSLCAHRPSDPCACIGVYMYIYMYSVGSRVRSTLSRDAPNTHATQRPCVFPQQGLFSWSAKATKSCVFSADVLTYTCSFWSYSTGCSFLYSEMIHASSHISTFWWQIVSVCMCVWMYACVHDMCKYVVCCFFFSVPVLDNDSLVACVCMYSYLFDEACVCARAECVHGCRRWD